MLYQALTTIPCLISDFLEAGHKRGMETNVKFLHKRYNYSCF